MSQASAFDAWNAGDAYEQYMGRWSRKIADRFLAWLAPESQRSWIDVGCGTGALSAAILRQCDPRNLRGVDASEGFVRHAEQSVLDRRVKFRVADAANLPFDRGRFEVLASGLVLNFIPDKVAALREFQRVVKPGGTLSFYVWDYPGGGMGMISTFWDTAKQLDPAAEELDESARFPFCTAEGLAELCQQAGIENAEIATLDETSDFADFSDFWTPFNMGAGPAPGYCAALSDDRREALRQALETRLGQSSFSLPARAWAVRAQVAE